MFNFDVQVVAATNIVEAVAGLERSQLQAAEQTAGFELDTLKTQLGGIANRRTAKAWGVVILSFRESTSCSRHDLIPPSPLGLVEPTVHQVDEGVWFFTGRGDDGA